MVSSTEVTTRGSMSIARDQHTTLPGDTDANQQLRQWGGVAGMVGAALLLGAGLVVGIMGLPDASDVETLTDFEDIRSGRIAEHFLYLGSLIFLALHVLTLYRFLRRDHPAAALFGAATAAFGFVIMAASSLLHVATSPLSDLYVSADTPADDLPSIEYAWHAGQSVFDTMLTTGVLLVPIGLLLLGVAMLAGSTFTRALGWFTVGLSAVGTLGAVIAVVDPGSAFSALGVVAIALVGATTGWHLLRHRNEVRQRGEAVTGSQHHEMSSAEPNR